MVQKRNNTRKDVRNSKNGREKAGLQLLRESLAWHMAVNNLSKEANYLVSQIHDYTYVLSYAYTKERFLALRGCFLVVCTPS